MDIDANAIWITCNSQNDRQRCTKTTRSGGELSELLIKTLKETIGHGNASQWLQSSTIDETRSHAPQGHTSAARSRTFATHRDSTIEVQCKLALRDGAQSRVAFWQCRGALFNLVSVDSGDTTYISSGQHLRRGTRAE
jgi:hypothetical protein